MIVALDTQLAVGTATGIGVYQRDLAQALRTENVDVRELSRAVAEPLALRPPRALGPSAPPAASSAQRRNAAARKRGHDAVHPHAADRRHGPRPRLAPRPIPHASIRAHVLRHAASPRIQTRGGNRLRLELQRKRIPRPHRRISAHRRRLPGRRRTLRADRTLPGPVPVRARRRHGGSPQEPPRPDRSIAVAPDAAHHRGRTANPVRGRRARARGGIERRGPRGAARLRRTRTARPPLRLRNVRADPVTIRRLRLRARRGDVRRRPGNRRALVVAGRSRRRRRPAHRSGRRHRVGRCDRRAARGRRRRATACRRIARNVPCNDSRGPPLLRRCMRSTIASRAFKIRSWQGGWRTVLWRGRSLQRILRFRSLGSPLAPAFQAPLATKRPATAPSATHLYQDYGNSTIVHSRTPRSCRRRGRCATAAGRCGVRGARMARANGAPSDRSRTMRRRERPRRSSAPPPPRHDPSA